MHLAWAAVGPPAQSGNSTDEPSQTAGRPALSPCGKRPRPRKGKYVKISINAIISPIARNRHSLDVRRSKLACNRCPVEARTESALPSRTFPTRSAFAEGRCLPANLRATRQASLVFGEASRQPTSQQRVGDHRPLVAPHRPASTWPRPSRGGGSYRVASNASVSPGSQSSDAGKFFVCCGKLQPVAFGPSLTGAPIGLPRQALPGGLQTLFRGCAHQARAAARTRAQSCRSAS